MGVCVYCVVYVSGHYDNLFKDKAQIGRNRLDTFPPYTLIDMPKGTATSSIDLFQKPASRLRYELFTIHVFVNLF
jgi:hypothetical protein